MNTKTMEGLIGAGTNIDLVNTPMRVFKEARRKGDTATMERSMGYAGDFAGKAEEYRVRADEGTLEEAKKAREAAELEREEALEKRREERREQKEKLAARRDEQQSLAEKLDEFRAASETSDSAVTEAERSSITETGTNAVAGTSNAIDNIVDTLEISKAGRMRVSDRYW